MRTTIELPDKLLVEARHRAAEDGIPLKQFFIRAVQEKLAPPVRKVRRPPPVIGRSEGPRIGVLTPEEVDEAMFG